MIIQKLIILSTNHIYDKFCVNSNFIHHEIKVCNYVSKLQNRHLHHHKLSK